jgi:hypothetical protein
MVFGLVLVHSMSWRWPIHASDPKHVEATSRRWITPAGPYFAIAELGTLSRIIFNGFWTCVGAFHVLEVANTCFGSETCWGHLQEMKCTSRTLFCHSRTGHSFSYNLQWFLDLCWCIPCLGGGLNIASVVYISLNMRKYRSILVLYDHILVVQ